MLKRILIAASFIALAACGVGPAHAAQPGATTFVTGNGDILSMDSALSVEPAANAPGMLKVVFTNGGDSLYYDNGLLNRILVAMPYMVQLQGTSRWINPNKSGRLNCANGTMYFGQVGASTLYFPDPNCTTTNQAKGNSF